MRIKQLEIFGFKSFADRAVLNFDSGVTGIVGPNGCGKSNIVDALRWVMGEQSAKHLRGGQMQDVIFNGSANKSPLGYAEVVLTLENDGQNVPQEYTHFTEIQVARRLYRTGDSEYEINKRPARLKDVMNVFLGTGVGTKAYSIIEQGRVSAIVSAKPEERRQMIEEAAGITKYKARRIAAERKMENTQHNLQRINDVKNEVESRLESLEKQAKKAERYQALQQELRHTELHYGAVRFLELSAGSAYLHTQEEAKKSELEALQNQLQQQETVLQAERAVLIEEEKSVSLMQSMLFEVENALALTKQDIAFLKTTQEGKQRQSVQVAEEIKRLSARHMMLCEEKNRYVSEQTESQQIWQSAEASLTKAMSDLQEFQHSRGQHVAQVHGLQKSIADLNSTVSKTQIQLQTLEKRQEDAKTRLEFVDKERSAVDHTKTQVEEALVQLQTDQSDIQTQREEIALELQAIKNQIEQKKEEAKQLAVEQKALEQKLSTKQSRLQSLQEIEQSYEWSSEGVSSIMQGQNHEHIIGLLADFVEAPDELEALVENVLRHQLESVLVKSPKDALTLTKQLTQSARGRVRFYSCDKEFQDKRYDSALVPGYRLVSRLKVLENQEALVHRILGNIFVVPTEEDALSAWAMAQKSGVLLVTAAGDVFDTDGAIMGGTRPKTSGVLGRKREIRENAQAIEQLKEEQANLGAKEQQLATQLAGFNSQWETLRTKEQALALSRVRLEESLSNKQSESRRLTESALKLNKEAENLLAFLQTSEADLMRLQEQWSQSSVEQKQQEEQLATLSRASYEFDQVLAEKNEQTTALKVNAASHKERVSHLERTLTQVNNNIADIAVQLENLTKQEIELSQELAQLKENQTAAEEKQESVFKERAVVAQQLDEQRERYNERAQVSQKLEQEIHLLRKSQDLLKNRLNELLLQRESYKLSMQALFDKLYERYELTPPQVLIDYHLLPLPEFEFEPKLNGLRRSIDNLGPINPNAITEFEELGQRYVFLKTQVDDLTDALNQLQAAIAKIDQTTQLRFEEAFNAINDRFSQVFPRLFRGGKAWLQLTQADDLLNTGVEIYAQPPGKKIGSIVLMSGGEKALTAISLIFAIFLIKPSPFCLLDEVDAPLDEANVERFSQIVKEMSNISQFIVITHNKRTMEVVDQLYGITMEDPGASKTVAVRVQEALQKQQVMQAAAL